MSRKVNPKVFRLKNAADWESRWLSKKNLPLYLEEDFRIREFLTKKLKDCSVQNIEIERFANKVSVLINTSRPGLIIGRGGKGAEDLKKELQGKLILKKGEKRELRMEIREIKNPWLSASLAAQFAAQQLEKRMPQRRVMKQTLEKIMLDKDAKGARIELSGRLGGNEIARREWLQKGRMPRQTLRAMIDYCHFEALCTYGKIGVKVWIYKGDEF
jgi:small subunit ribosomal protein S3